MYFYCCAKCFIDVTEESSEELGFFWVSLCKTSLEEGVGKDNILVFYENSRIQKTLDKLEKFKLITTHENNHKMLVRVNGCFFDNYKDTYCFCVNQNEHT